MPAQGPHLRSHGHQRVDRHIDAPERATQQPNDLPIDYGLVQEVVVRTLSNMSVPSSQQEPERESGMALVSNPRFGSDRAGLPLLLTVDEAADLLRTSRRAIYAMVERRQLAGVVRIRRRVLFRTDSLLDWVHRKSAP